MSSSDPLSFFAGEDSSESESEGEESQKDAKQKANLQESNKAESTSEVSTKLPSPDTLFATVGRPSFLDTAVDTHINWDRFVKKPEENIHETDTHVAIPPPSDLDSGDRSKPVSSGLSIAIASTYSEPSTEISAKPVRYTSQDVDSKFRTVSDSNEGEGEVKAGSKHTLPQEKDSGTLTSASKKAKTVETFRQKEKRKRNSGQTSRGKSYVEEEKRILRQQFSTDEVMS